MNPTLKPRARRRWWFLLAVMLMAILAPPASAEICTDWDETLLHFTPDGTTLNVDERLTLRLESDGLAQNIRVSVPGIEAYFFATIASEVTMRPRMANAGTVRLEIRWLEPADAALGTEACDGYDVVEVDVVAASRVTGRYRILYEALGSAPSVGPRVWTMQPICLRGSCAVKMVSRKPGERRVQRRARFEFDGVNEWRRVGTSRDACVVNGRVVGHWDYQAVQQFSPTRVAKQGRVLGFRGMLVEHFRPDAQGREACADTTYRYKVTGYAI